MAKNKQPRVKIEKPAKQTIVADDDTIALYAYLLLGQQARVKQEQRNLTAIAKQAAQQGVTWPAIKDAMKEYEKTPDDRRKKAEEAARIYSAIGVPAQMEMFEAYEPKVNDDEAAAERKGRFAAICHGEEKAPWAVGSTEGQAWIRGYRAVMSLVADHENRMENKLPPADPKGSQAAADAEDWGGDDAKPVKSVEALEKVGAAPGVVNHDDATAK